MDNFDTLTNALPTDDRDALHLQGQSQLEQHSTHSLPPAPWVNSAPVSTSSAHLNAPTPSAVSRTTSVDDRSSIRSREEVWFLKEIPFTSRGETRMYKIITQNFNGYVHLHFYRG
jgi:hypothetical protein